MKGDSDKNKYYLELALLPILAALINTTIGNEYILALNGFISKPLIFGGGFWSDYMVGYRYFLLITPLLTAAIVAIILSRYTFISVFIGIFLGAIETVILSFLFLAFIPQLLGDITILAATLVYSKEIMLFIVFPVFPFSFAGGLIGAVIGDRYIFQETKKEKKEFKEEVDEWVDFLSERVKEKEDKSEEELSGRFKDGSRKEMIDN